jgi:hypothetical protein
MVTAGHPRYTRLLDLDFEQTRRALDEHSSQLFQVVRDVAHKVRPGGTLVFMGGTGCHRQSIGMGFVSNVTAALPALTASLALELAPVR